MPGDVVLGLRPRLVAGMLLTSVATLLAAALFLLPPLDHRLRADQLASLLATAQTARSSFVDLGPGAVRPGSPELAVIVDVLERRAGARGVVVDGGGHVLTGAAADPGAVTAARLALRRNDTVSRVVASRDGPVANVAAPILLAGRPGALVLDRPLETARSAAAVVRRAFTVAALIGLAVAVIVGLGMASTLSRRLRRLHAAVVNVGSGGLETSVPSDKTRDEVGALSRGFAAMQARLRAQERARRVFVSTASHELRTPIASLSAMLELAEADLRGTPARVPHALDEVVRARRQSERLAALARDLLDLSRLDAEVPLRHEPVDMVELARAVVAEFAQRAAQRRIALALAPSRGSHLALADPVGVARIVRTLIENAVLYIPDAGRIAVGVERRQGVIELSVADSGPGVLAEEREAIFARFRRGSAGRRTPGFGLGLAIGRELARRMGGDLRLTQAAHGACFILSLPAAGRPSGGGVVPAARIGDGA
jgi:signal transduction histidine kinase